MEKEIKKTGWEVLDNNNRIVLTQPISRITMIIERNTYLEKYKIRISRKNLTEAFKLLNKKAQIVRQKKKSKVKEEE